MADQDQMILAFNRGVLDSKGLARIDLERYAFAADTQRNFIPRVLGSMMLRPGLKYIDECIDDNDLVRQIPFVFEADDTALLEVNTNSDMIVRIDDVELTRPSVVTVFDNGIFNGVNDAAPPLWTIDDDANCDSFILNNQLELRGSGEGFARTYQTVTVAAPDQNVEHGLSITVVRGQVNLKVGSTVQGDEYISDTILTKGFHKLSFTPTGDFTLELSNDKEYNATVSTCTIDTGAVLLTTNWNFASELQSLRWTQSGDRLYIAVNGRPQKVIERRFDGRSWSIVDFISNDGPFEVLNTSATTMQISAIQGDYDPNFSTYVTLTASNPIFKNGHASGTQGPGALFRLASQGQVVTNTSSADDGTDTNPIRVVGTGNAREFGVIVEGTFSATVTLQFAYDVNGPWNDQGATYSSPTSTTINDGQDDQIIFYRLIVKLGDWTSGDATMTLNYTGGSIEGICRVRSIVSDTVARVSVLSPFGSIEATKDWWEGTWSDVKKFPTSVVIHEGRLFWAGDDRIWGSVSDNFESYNDDTEGDSGPINRTIGEGSTRVVHWLLSMARMIMGTSENSADIAAQRMDGNNPLSARSTNFEEPLTPFNFNIKTVHSRGVFVDRTLQRLYELVYDIDIQDFKPVDLSIFTPDFNVNGITQIAVQMKPDLRVHCVRNDGTVGMLVYDRAENVMAWVDVALGGLGDWEVQDVAVLPGTVEDQVYYTVKAFNNVDGERRYLLKWSMESEAVGGLNNYMADAWTQYDSVPTSMLTGLNHLAGLEVCIWADGDYIGNGTVTEFGTPGQLDLSGFSGAPFSNVVVGLQYTGRFKSTKLATLQGIGLLEHKKVNKIGFLAENLHHLGLQYGPDFTNLSDMPQVEQGQVVVDGTVYESYHEENFPFGGEWNADSRICLLAQGPKPVTMLAAIADFQSVEVANQRSK